MVQHRIDVPVTVLGPEFLGQLHRLVDDHLHGNLGVPAEFGAAEPENPVLHRIEAFALVILLAAVFFVPGFSDGLFAGAVALSMLLGVPGEAMQAGWDAFHFWR